jgi:hypothetical protein
MPGEEISGGLPRAMRSFVGNEENLSRLAFSLPYCTGAKVAACTVADSARLDPTSPTRLQSDPLPLPLPMPSSSRLAIDADWRLDRAQELSLA